MQIITDETNQALTILRQYLDPEINRAHSSHAKLTLGASHLRLIEAELTRLADLAVQQAEDLAKVERAADHWEIWSDTHDCYEVVGERW